jgi:hypothetical protein
MQNMADGIICGVLLSLAIAGCMLLFDGFKALVDDEDQG